MQDHGSTRDVAAATNRSRQQTEIQALDLDAGTGPTKRRDPNHTGVRKVKKGASVTASYLPSSGAPGLEDSSEAHTHITSHPEG